MRDEGGGEEERGDGAQIEPYMRAFDRFFAKALPISTYKPVFVSALVDAGRWEDDDGLAGRQWIRAEGDGRVSVGLDFVAIRFAKFYWDMTAGFGARHVPERMADPDNPAKDVLNIVKVINAEIEEMEREEIRRAAMSAGTDPKAVSEAAAEAARRARAGLKPPTLGRLAADDMAPFRHEVVKRAIVPEVLPHLHGDMPELYEIKRGEDRIVLGRGAIAYMRQSRATLKAALSYMIARRLEEINPSMRHVASKIRPDMPYDDRLRNVVKLESKAIEQRADIDSLCRISSDLTARLEKLAALWT